MTTALRTVAVDRPKGTGVVRCTLSVDTSHLCPIRDEIDLGRLTVVWEVLDVTLEVHDLTRYLRSFTQTHCTHEALVRTVQAALRSLVDVVSVTWDAKPVANAAMVSACVTS